MEAQYLRVLQKKSKSRGKTPHESFVLHGSRLCRETEYMVIVSDGDIQPQGVDVVRRKHDATLRKQALNKHKDLLSLSPAFNILSDPAAIDLKIITHNILLSKFKDLTSLKLDVKGEEREKGHYLKAIEEFIKNCRYNGGKMYAEY